MAYEMVRRMKNYDNFNMCSIWTARKGKELGEIDETSSFFFTKFPKTYRENKMAEIFKEFGIVMEVFIPTGRDKRGKRHGFVQFKKVKEERIMAVKLDNIQIKGRKIFANAQRVVRKNMSGVEGVEGKRNLRRWEKRIKEIPTFAHLQFNIRKNEIERFEKAFVCEVKKTRSTYNVHDAINAEGVFQIKAIPFGAKLCLLEESVLRPLIQEDVSWITRWFGNIHPWSLEDIDNERLTWLKCFGLPYHAWSPEFFKFISGSVGEFVCCDEETEMQKHLDVTSSDEEEDGEFRGHDYQGSLGGIQEGGCSKDLGNEDSVEKVISHSHAGTHVEAKVEEVSKSNSEEENVNLGISEVDSSNHITVGVHKTINVDENKDSMIGHLPVVEVTKVLIADKNVSKVQDISILGNLGREVFFYSILCSPKMPVGPCFGPQLRKKKLLNEIYENIKIPFSPSNFSTLVHSTNNLKPIDVDIVNSAGANPSSPSVEETSSRCSRGSILCCES
ncbi:hypothetical protein KIW84_013049 [Lathyrus oleraceus]|uniref:RRM domain-containing protein n=1 Tax=Pisum sativum TaxID=3888 RepID=A0A9D5BJ33_PEA|nr:hypothetical protein KIW84_013049 [Pisum sativum]